MFCKGEPQPEDRLKFKIPNSKFQTNSKSQIQNEFFLSIFYFLFSARKARQHDRTKARQHDVTK